jgi:hypothetical protein
MIGKTVVAIAVGLLLSGPVQAQTGQGTAPGVTSGPAADTPTRLNSPQSGPLETPHQRDTVRDQSQSVRDPAKQNAPGKNDDHGATGSSSPGPGVTPGVTR